MLDYMGLKILQAQNISQFTQHIQIWSQLKKLNACIHYYKNIFFSEFLNKNNQNDKCKKNHPKLI
jgi:hypothetical protein